MENTLVSAAHLNVNCLERMMATPRLSYDWLRFDSNNDCNLHCVYCHNARSKEKMELATFERFLSNNIDKVENFQFGSRMEPTLDPRLVDFMEALHDSSVQPQRSIVLQTNAILLHRHDANRMVAAGLTDIQVSIDTINAEVFASLRGGAKLDKVLRNIRGFSEQFPDVSIKFIVTVAKSNYPYVEDLVEFGAEIGAKAVIVREMFHTPGAAAHMDDDTMARLVLDDGAFGVLADRLKTRFSHLLTVNCIDAKGVRGYSAGVHAHSYRSNHLQIQMRLRSLALRLAALLRSKARDL